MSNGEIIVSQRNAKFERLTDEFDPKAILGKYFNAVDDIPARVETSKRSASHFDKTVSDDGKVVERYTARRPIAKSTVLLALRIHYLDGIFHSVEFAAHPSDKDQSNLSFLAEEFYSFFAHEDNWQNIRAKEIAFVQEKMAQQQAFLATSITMPQLSFDPIPKDETTLSQEGLSKAISIAHSHEERAKAMIKSAEDMAAMINQAQQDISATATELTRYMVESGKAKMAEVSEVLEHASKLQQGVRSLSLYKGDMLEVRRLTSGQDAPSGEPLTLFQNKLYLDEELGINTATGGFNFFNMGDLDALFSSDHGFIDRIIPTARGVALVQIRRSEFRYHENPFYDFKINELADKPYLLLRNGGNVFLVHMPDIEEWEKTQTLFPTQKEIDDIFKHFGREINPDHLEFTRAMNKFERTAVNYKRLFLILWGLQDREGVFGSFYDTDKITSWFGPEFQTQHLHYVHDAENVLEHARPSVFEWFDKANEKIRVGSRVVVKTSAAFTKDSAPEYFTEVYSEKMTMQKRWPSHAIALSTVTERKGAIRFAINISKENASAYEQTERSVDGVAQVDLGEALAGDKLSLLCIDDITLEDVDYYLNSRKERVQYMRFIDLLLSTRALLAQEKEELVPIESLLNRTLLKHIPDYVVRHAAIRDALALWRKGNKGAVPQKDAHYQTVALIAQRLCLDPEALLSKIASNDPSVAALDLRLDDNGTIWLYRKLHAHEQLACEKEYPNIAVAKLRIDENGRLPPTDKGVKTTTLTEPKIDLISQVKLDEDNVARLFETSLLANTPRDAAQFTNRHFPGFIGPVTFERLFLATSTDQLHWLQTIDAETLYHSIEEILERPAATKEAGKRGEPGILMPLGLVTWKQEKNAIESLRGIVGRVDARKLLYLLEDEDKAMSVKLAKTYANRPEDYIKHLEQTVGNEVEGLIQIKLLNKKRTIDVADSEKIMDISATRYLNVSTGYLNFTTGETTAFSNADEAILKTVQVSTLSEGRLIYTNAANHEVVNRWYDRMNTQKNDEVKKPGL